MQTLINILIHAPPGNFRRLFHVSACFAAFFLYLVPAGIIASDLADEDLADEVSGIAPEPGENNDGDSLVSDIEPPAPESTSLSELEPASEDHFDIRVRTMEGQVTELKEKIFQTKARLLMLQETVIGGDLSTGAMAVLMHRNNMGGSFMLESITYILDGVPIYTKVDMSGELDKQKEIEIFSGRIAPGNHQLVVRLVYRGRGYGIFSYLNDYRFRVQSSYTFNAEGGKSTRVTVVGYERGGFTAEMQDRPGVRYEEEVTRVLPGMMTTTVIEEETL